jgi:hypothetical protein
MNDEGSFNKLSVRIAQFVNLWGIRLYDSSN